MWKDLGQGVILYLVILIFLIDAASYIELNNSHSYQIRKSTKSQTATYRHSALYLLSPSSSLPSSSSVFAAVTFITSIAVAPVLVVIFAVVVSVVATVTAVEIDTKIAVR